MVSGGGGGGGLSAELSSAFSSTHRGQARPRACWEADGPGGAGPCRGTQLLKRGGARGRWQEGGALPAWRLRSGRERVFLLRGGPLFSSSSFRMILPRLDRICRIHQSRSKSSASDQREQLQVSPDTNVCFYRLNLVCAQEQMEQPC